MQNDIEIHQFLIKDLLDKNNDKRNKAFKEIENTTIEAIKKKQDNTIRKLIDNFNFKLIRQ